MSFVNFVEKNVVSKILPLFLWPLVFSTDIYIFDICGLFSSDYFKHFLESILWNCPLTVRVRYSTQFFNWFDYAGEIQYTVLNWFDYAGGIHFLLSNPWILVIFLKTTLMFSINVTTTLSLFFIFLKEWNEMTRNECLFSLKQKWFLSWLRNVECDMYINLPNAL